MCDDVCDSLADRSPSVYDHACEVRDFSADPSHHFNVQVVTTSEVGSINRAGHESRHTLNATIRKVFFNARAGHCQDWIVDTAGS